jgi:hypothetical protein
MAGAGQRAFGPPAPTLRPPSKDGRSAGAAEDLTRGVCRDRCYRKGGG